MKKERDEALHVTHARRSWRRDAQFRRLRRAVYSRPSCVSESDAYVTCENKCSNLHDVLRMVQAKSYLSLLDQFNSYFGGSVVGRTVHYLVVLNQSFVTSSGTNEGLVCGSHNPVIHLEFSIVQK
ncbi:hypothetical protein J6590_037521 [Homalodisca vitripennis]|nr:hypothetical protein J6590_037521 [Homalodisca vitripennis]